MTLDELYARSGPVVLRRCIQMLGREEAALDAMHWTFLRAIEVGFEPRTPGESLSWLYRTATRRCLTVLRNDRRRRDIASRHASELAPARFDLEGQLVQRDLAERALGMVDDRAAEVALLTVFQELPVARAAEALGCSKRTVLRARKLFAGAIRELMEDP